MDSNNDHVVASGTSKKPKPKFLWDHSTLMVFINLCMTEIKNGNRPTSHFSKAGWVNIEKNMKEQTAKCFDRKQLKNKWDNMKKEWKLFDRLMRLETGIGWDPVKKTIQAPAKWWDEKIQGNKDYAKFRDTNLEIYESCYAPLFRNSVAVGDRTKAPTDYQNNNDPTNEDYNEGNEDSDGIDLGEQDEPLFPASSSSKRKKSNTVTLTRSTKGKSSGSTPWVDKLDGVIEAISARSTQSFPPKDSSPTTQECMDIVTCFPEFEEGSRMYCRALRIFLKKQIRENFMVPNNHAAKMEFLKLMMEEENRV